MATKIRLQRHGKKDYAFFHVVVADSRAPRDGRFIEKLGYYNPNTNPATIEINFERALHWLNVGAQPTETCKRILSYKGVLLKKHLLQGVKKGAISEADAEKKFQDWLNQKLSKIESKKQKLLKESEEQKAARIKAEAEYRQQKESKKSASASASESSETSAAGNES
ncbi:MAG: 30S ribosomal protein S16 [Bacteroidia bacterium]|nr:30S ribosomal protein S16 [Bacteroidia bacterium]